MNSATRPANPADISFAARCFVQSGTRAEWTVGGNLAPNYPAKFASEEAAMAFARKTGRVEFVTKTEHPVMKRIAWA